MNREWEERSNQQWKERRQRRELSWELGEKALWLAWIDRIPYISWPPDWQVKAIPPFYGALVRYYVRREDTPEGEQVSIYLDVDNSLGYSPEGPCWEVYPGTHGGGTERCDMYDTDDLLDLIRVGLDYAATDG